MFWGKRMVSGIDIGHDSIKICTLKPNTTFCNVSLHPSLPQRSSREEVLEGAALSQRLKSLCSELASVSKSKIHISLHTPTTASGYLELPKLKAGQMEVAIPSAIAREIPHALHEVQLFHLPVPALNDKEAQGIFFVSIPKSIQAAQTLALTQAGFEVNHSEPGLLACLRGLSRNQKLNPEEVIALVIAGFQRTCVIILKGSHPYFCREFRMAGSDFTYAFQMGDQVDWAQAEEYKRNYNVNERDFKVESFLLRWLTDVERSLGYALQKNALLKPSRIIFSGGTSLWKGLASRLSEFLNLPVTCHQWDLLKPNLSHGPNEIALYDEAIGLVC